MEVDDKLETDLCGLILDDRDVMEAEMGKKRRFNEL